MDTDAGDKSKRSTLTVEHLDEIIAAEHAACTERLKKIAARLRAVAQRSLTKDRK